MFLTVNYNVPCFKSKCHQSDYINMQLKSAYLLNMCPEYNSRSDDETWSTEYNASCQVKVQKRWIWDDITWFPKYFWQMTIARSEDINKDVTSILNLLKKLSSRKHFGTVLTGEIRIAKLCTEVFVMPKQFRTNLDIPESSLYMSPLRAIVLFQQYCRITVIW